QWPVPPGRLVTPGMSPVATLSTRLAVSVLAAQSLTQSTKLPAKSAVVQSTEPEPGYRLAVLGGSISMAAGATLPVTAMAGMTRAARARSTADVTAVTFALRPRPSDVRVRNHVDIEPPAVGWQTGGGFATHSPAVQATR